MQILTRELVNLANGDTSEFKLFKLKPATIDYNLTTNDSATALFLQSQLLAQAEKYRELFLTVDDPSFKEYYDSAIMNT